MNEERTTSRQTIPAWTMLLVAVAALVIATAALTATLVGRAATPAPGWMMGGYGGMMGPGSAMMGGRIGMVGPAGAFPPGLQPGDAGFVAGTVAQPRVIRVIAGPGYAFSPPEIAVARGETVTFEVTTMGPLVHEFMVGPADAVTADEEGTPEIEDIGMMQTKTLTHTFDGPGPYAFACHVEGHHEAGMHGTITVVG